MFQYGATVELVEFEYIVSIGEREIILSFMERGADLITGFPIATGLIRQTRSFLGIYKSNIEKHPELQFQADMALRHFCDEGNLRGVSLLMWLGISADKHDKNLGVYLSMVAEEITERTEWKVTVHPWNGGWSGPTHRLLVKRKLAEFDDVVKQIQILGISQGKVLKKETVVTSLRAILEPTHT